MKLADIEKFASDLLDIEKEIDIKKAELTLEEKKGGDVKRRRTVLEKAEKLLPDVAEAYTMNIVGSGFAAPLYYSIGGK